MEQSPLWEFNSFLVSQENSCGLWNKTWLPYWQKPATCPYPELYNSGPCCAVPFWGFKVHFNIIPSVHGCSKRSLSFRFFHQNSICSSSPHTCHYPPPPISSPLMQVWGPRVTFYHRLILRWWFSVVKHQNQLWWLLFRSGAYQFFPVSGTQSSRLVITFDIVFRVLIFWVVTGTLV